MTEPVIKGVEELVRTNPDKFTKASAYHMVRRGLIPFVRKGRLLYFRQSEIDAAFSSQPTETASHG